MNARRYVVCGVVSVALHGLAFAAQAPPPQQPKFSMNDSLTGGRVAIQLVAAPEAKPEKTEKLKQEVPSVKEPKQKVPLVKKIKPDEAKTEQKPKPEAAKNLTTEQKIVQDETKKVVSKSQPVKPHTLNESEPEYNVTSTKNESDPQIDQAKDNAPVLVERPEFKVKPRQPKYPRIAKRRGMEGNVLIEVWLDEDGNQIKQNVLKSSGFEVLDTAALVAVKKWRFNSYHNDGVALAHRVRIPVRFNLD